MSQDASNSGSQDGSGFNTKAADISHFGMAMATESGDSLAPSSSNKIESFYFRLDTLFDSGAMNQKYNIQLNLGLANPGFADHYIQFRADEDGVNPEVIIVLFRYDEPFPAIAAFTSGAITGKVSNVASPYSSFSSDGGVVDANATGAIGQYDGTNYAIELKTSRDLVRLHR